MLERTKFILAYQEGLYSMTELCQHFAVSRKTGYKWLSRFEEKGLDGLEDLSHATHLCPHRMPSQVEELLLETRRAHPSWGPRKLLPYVARRHPELTLPAPSTVGALLKRHGLTEPRRRSRKVAHPGKVPLQTQAPNEVWTADFKGQFPTGDGQYCYPLTVADAYSRFVLGCNALPSIQLVGVFPAFEQLFREYGLPEVIRTDNGNPFATRALCGLSKLSVWWIKLGIRHQRIEPGRPEQNGRHERMHRTLKAETTRPPEQDLQAQQRRFDAFRREFNQERPHEALSGAVPASHYRKSEREMPSRMPEPQYPGHFELRWVSRAGTFRFKSRQLFLSDTLIHEWIGLEEVDDGIWSVYFHDVLLARLDERDFKLSA